MEWQNVFPLSSSLIGREEQEKAVNLALLSGEHALLCGPPGTGKSMLVTNIFKQIKNSKVFSAQLSKFSTEEVLFGPLDVAALRRGEYRYVYENTILDADMAFIDEIFDASDVLLRSLLGVLNERRFTRGAFSIQCPLLTAVATANYQRINEVTEAVVDRFLVQFYVSPLSPEEKIKLINFNEGAGEIQGKVTLAELKSIQDAVLQVRFPSHLHAPFVELAGELGFTDRRIVKAIKILKASAFLRGATEITWSDLYTLKYLCSLTPERGKEVEEVIAEGVKEKSVVVEQTMLLDSLEKQWNNTPGDLKSHLQEEAKVIRSLVAINPCNEDIARRRDSLLQKYKKHYSEGLQNYLQKQDLELV